MNQASGVKDNSQNPVLRGQLTAAMGNQKLKSIAANTANMPRPQLLFDDAPVDNFRETLFELKLKTKPNAVVPLPAKMERIPVQSKLPVLQISNAHTSTVLLCLICLVFLSERY